MTAGVALARGLLGDVPVENEPSREEITLQLRQAAAGDERAQNEVFRLLEPQIKEIAKSFLRRESSANSMQTTMLVDDAFMKFLGNPKAVEIQDRQHFLALMRKYVKQLLIDAARIREAKKRGGGQVKVSLQDGEEMGEEDAHTFLILMDALKRLSDTRAPAAEVFELREILQIAPERIATTLQISDGEVDGLYRYASAWIKRELGNG